MRQLILVSILTGMGSYGVQAQTTPIIDFTDTIGTSGSQLHRQPGGEYWNVQKGYPKRPRMSTYSLAAQSPSQLHEVSGPVFEAAYLYSGKDYERTLSGGDIIDSSSRNNTANIRGFHSIGDAVIGISGEFSQAEIETYSVFIPDVKSDKVTIRPQLAYTFGKFATIGLGGEFTQESLTYEAREISEDSEVIHQYGSATVGVSMHNEYLEAGMSYTTEVEQTDEFENSDDFLGSEPAEHTVYRPSQETLYLRGNINNNYSVLGSASYSNYDRANGRQDDELFDKYKLEDRMSGLLQLAYWTDRTHQYSRSRVSIAAKYEGAATAGSYQRQDRIDGENIANLTGLEAEILWRYNPNFSVSLLGSYMTGERDETVDERRYAQSLVVVHVGTGVNIRL